MLPGATLPASLDALPGTLRAGRRAKASLAKGPLTWLADVTAIITSCVPPKVVGEVTSSVTATGVLEVYGLPRTGRNHVRFPAHKCWTEGYK